MRNGPYELIIVSKEYPGKLYRGRYAYEHHYVYWKHTGHILKVDEILHHKNNNRRDNRFENLQLTTKPEHNRIHNLGTYINLICPVCGISFSKLRHRTHLLENIKLTRVAVKGV